MRRDQLKHFQDRLAFGVGRAMARRLAHRQHHRGNQKPGRADEKQHHLPAAEAAEQRYHDLGAVADEADDDGAEHE